MQTSVEIILENIYIDSSINTMKAWILGCSALAAVPVALSA